MPLVSIIIPIYNSRPYLADVAEGIRRQEWPELEIIGIDDGSTDGSPEEFARLLPEATLLQQTNAGPSAARNAGLAVARGEYIAFLDSDDVWPEGKLAHQISRLENDEQLSISIGHIAVFADYLPDGRSAPRKWAPSQLLFFLGSMVCRRAVFARIGLFDAVRCAYLGEDHDWFLRAWEAAEPIEVSPEVTLHYRRRPDSLTTERNMIAKSIVGMVKASLDRRRAAGNVAPMPKCLRFLGQDAALRTA